LFVFFSCSKNPFNKNIEERFLEGETKNFCDGRFNLEQGGGLLKKTSGNSDILEGTLFAVAPEVFKNNSRTLSYGGSKEEHYLKKSNGEILKLEASSPVIKEQFYQNEGFEVLLSGESHFQISQNSSMNPSLEVLNVGGIIRNPASKLVIQSTKSLKPLIIVANFTDVQSSNFFNQTKAEAYSDMLKKYYEEVSFGQISINNDVNNDNKPDVAFVTFNMPRTCNFSFYLQQSSINKIKDVGLDPANYTHFAWVTQKSASMDNACGYGGIATRPGNVLYAPIAIDMVLVHEMGHNLGLYHSSKDMNKNGVIEASVSEVYGDHTDPLGNSMDAPSNFNPTNFVRLGLLDTAPQLIKTLTDSGEFDLSPLDDTNSVPHFKILKITGINNKNLMLSYRSPKNRDANIKSAMRGVTLYESKVFNNGSNYGATGSMNMGNLKNVNDVLTDPTSGLKITLLSISDEAAKVTIEYPDAPTTTSGGNSGGNSTTNGGTTNSGGSTNGTTNTSSGTNNGGTSCVVHPTSIEVVKVLKTTALDKFELDIIVKNNDVDCDVKTFDLKLQSDDMELDSGSEVVFLDSGEEKNLTLEIQVKQNALNFPFLLGDLELKLNSVVNSSKQIKIKQTDCP